MTSSFLIYWQKDNTIKTKHFSVPDLLFLVNSSHLWYVHENVVDFVFHAVIFGTSKLWGNNIWSIMAALTIKQLSLTFCRASLFIAKPERILISRMTMLELLSFPEYLKSRCGKMEEKNTKKHQPHLWVWLPRLYFQIHRGSNSRAGTAGRLRDLQCQSPDFRGSWDVVENRKLEKRNQRPGFI